MKKSVRLDTWFVPALIAANIVFGGLSPRFLLYTLDVGLLEFFGFYAFFALLIAGVFAVIAVSANIQEPYAMGHFSLFPAAGYIVVMVLLSFLGGSGWEFLGYFLLALGWISFSVGSWFVYCLCIFAYRRSRSAKKD